MADIVNTQAKRLYDSLLNYTDEQTAVNIACGTKLPQNPSEKKKFEWAEDICDKLDNSFDIDIVKHIRMDCCCKPSSEKMKAPKDTYTKSRDLNDYAEKLNHLNLGASFWCENNSLYMSYPVCYCSYVKKTDKLLPASWCYCTLGYTKYMFEFVFDCEIETELLESVKTGGTRCVIKITKCDKTINE